MVMLWLPKFLPWNFTKVLKENVISWSFSYNSFVKLSLYNSLTVKFVLSDHSKRRPNIGFQDQLSLNAGQKYCRILQESILQYFRPSLSYHLSLRPLFCLYLSGPLRQVYCIKWSIPMDPKHSVTCIRGMHCMFY